MFTRHISFLYLVLIYGAITAFVCSIIIALIMLYIPTQEQKVPKKSNETVVMSQPLTTDTWGIFDPKTGAVLAGNNLDEERPIASISKLFTALAVVESNRKNDAFTITETDVNTEGRSGKLKFGEMVTPYTLLFPLLIESSNDAAVAIARYLDDEFISVLTDTKKSLALNHTNISEPSGLSLHNTSSVSDLAIFYAYLADSHPHILDITRLKMYVALRTGYINNNPAAQFPTYSGGKHGFSPEAGRTFVGAFHDSKENTDVGMVILGSSDLKHDIEVLKSQSATFLTSSDIMTP